MKGVTHLLLGAAIGLYIGYDALSSITASMVSGTSALIPDLDLHLGHRKTLHNIFALAVFTIMVSIILDHIGVRNELIPKAVALGWLTHILSDVLNIQGVYLFYPFSEYSISLKIARSDSMVLNILVSLLSIILIVLRILQFTY
ncbi:metal-dependent hydrolase [Desulfurococcus amylolyticus]|uniref:Membrane-bound metal-dependent hydrolase n=1 Tax=Desulfurococcus amylolyticus DSM 16532 TaxID=768672 RepID=I3XRC2_DESAM|nr:metal-dependent hydrolase [Desulfurococcus amylolyticus]AFL66496.1 membrane-bound metal-dependent hydrolase [Desulfurococcus amylolyticus DSM 16532]